MIDVEGALRLGRAVDRFAAAAAYCCAHDTPGELLGVWQLARLLQSEARETGEVRVEAVVMLDRIVNGELAAGRGAWWHNTLAEALDVIHDGVEAGLLEKRT